MTDAVDLEFDVVYLAHWELGRIVAITGRRFFGLRPRVENWYPHFPPELPPVMTNLKLDRLSSRYFRLRVLGRLGPKGMFGHKGICSHELFITRIISCEETSDPGPLR